MRLYTVPVDLGLQSGRCPFHGVYGHPAGLGVKFPAHNPVCGFHDLVGMGIGLHKTGFVVHPVQLGVFQDDLAYRAGVEAKFVADRLQGVAVGDSSHNITEALSDGWLPGLGPGALCGSFRLGHYVNSSRPLSTMIK